MTISAMMNQHRTSWITRNDWNPLGTATVYNPVRMSKGHEAGRWWSEPSCLFPVVNSVIWFLTDTKLLTWKLSVGNWWQGTDVTHVWSHTVSTDTHTNPFITHRQCEAQARAGLSFDVSATLLAVCLTLLPFRGKTLWNTLCEPLTMFCVWVLMYKAAGSWLLKDTSSLTLEVIVSFMDSLNSRSDSGQNIIAKEFPNVL